MSEINPSVPQEQPTQKVETTQNQTETKPLTPEQIEQRVLEEALELSGLNLDDLKKFYKDCSSCNLKILKQEIQASPEEQLIEKQARELYKIYIEEGLDSGNTEVVSLDALSNSIDSPRLEDMKNEIEKVLEGALKKYDFLDAQTKNFVKIGIVNSMLKSPVGEIGESLVGGFANFVEKLKDVKQDDLSGMVKALNPEPKDSGRTLTLQEKFAKNLESYTKKFDEINNKFEELKITDEKEKQNIISHIDWFRNPALIEAGVDGLNLSQLNINNKDDKNKNPLDTKAISEYMVNSREKVLELSKKLNIGDKAGDTIYGLINGGGMVGEGVQKIVEIILKLPFIGKFFAMFLGLNPDPEKALSELKENSSNFKLVSALKGLGATLDKDGKVIPGKEGKESFKEIDLSGINFNVVKNEMKEVKNITGEQSEEGYQKMWQEAFDKGIDKDGVKLKFDLGDKKDGKLTNSKLKEILKNGLKNFNEDKEKNKVDADTKKREEEMEKNKKEESALGIFSGKGLSNISQLGDFYDFKNIKLADINNQTDEKELGLILKKAIGEGGALVASDYEKLDNNTKNALLKAINLIQEFLSNNTEFDIKNKNVGDLLKDQKFQKFLQNKEKNQEEFKKQMGMEEKIRSASDISLSEKGLEIEEGKIITFDKDKQQLNIGNDKYDIKLKVEGEDYKLQNIKILDNKIEFIPDSMLLNAKIAAGRIKDQNLGYIGKEEGIKGITELTKKGSFTHEKDKTKLSFSKVDV